MAPGAREAAAPRRGENADVGHSVPAAGAPGAVTVRAPERFHDPLSIGQLQSLVRYQQAMLRDGRRNQAFLRALRKTVHRGARVLDVGSGSGVWAVVAARLGARRVVAVEREPLLRPLIEQLAAENGVAARVEVIAREFRRVELRREFDVVVSETVGSMAFEEDIVPIMAKARERFLRRGGALVPDTIVFRAAPVRVRGSLPQPATLLPRVRSLHEHMTQIPRPLYVGEYDLLAPACDLARVDLTQCPADHVELGNVAASWPVQRADRVDGVAVWLRLRLAPGVWLETRASGAWSVKLFPCEPFKARRGELTFHLDSSVRRDRWQVALQGRHGLEEKAYGPELAYDAIMAALRRVSRSGRRKGRAS